MRNSSITRTPPKHPTSEIVRTLTPAASAVHASVQPCSNRRNAKPRLCGQVLALPCNFIRIPPRCWWHRHPPASEEDRMEQPAWDLQLDAGALRLLAPPLRRRRLVAKAEPAAIPAERTAGPARLTPAVGQASALAPSRVVDPRENLVHDRSLRCWAPAPDGGVRRPSRSSSPWCVLRIRTRRLA